MIIYLRFGDYCNNMYGSNHFGNGEKMREEALESLGGLMGTLMYLGKVEMAKIVFDLMLETAKTTEGIE